MKQNVNKITEKDLNRIIRESITEALAPKYNVKAAMDALNAYYRTLMNKQVSGFIPQETLKAMLGDIQKHFGILGGQQS